MNMAELLIRAGAKDTALVERVLQGPTRGRPSRVVVDAHVAVGSPRIAAAAVAAGVPFIVDPQTHYLQDHQHLADPWAQLPYARPAISTPADLLRPGLADAVVAGAIEHQLAFGATMLIAPYVHIERRNDGWAQVQVALWRASKRYLDEHGVQLPLIAVLALGWRLLDRPSWPENFSPLRRELLALNPAEVALAASRVDAGVKPDERLASMIAVIRRISRTHPVIAWQQGTLGEAAVAGGAVGYECGIGWRERCDLGTAMAQHRQPTSGGSARPVYIDTLRRSIPKASIRALVANSGLVTDLICLDPTCCPNGRLNLLEDPRAHAIQARLRSLRDLTSPAQPAWQWNHLARAARDGIELAERINAFATRSGGVTRIDLAALHATLSLADNRRQTLRRRHAA